MSDVGYRLTADDQDAVFTMLDLASGGLGEHALTDWIRLHLAED